MKLDNIIFLGSPDFAVPSLEALFLNFGASLQAVITSADAPKGRSQKLTSTPVKTWAQTHNIPVYTPANKSELAVLVDQLQPDCLVVVAYGMLISKDITERYLCLNVHASLLPKYRGAAPMQAVFLNQEKETGITLMKIIEKLDAGPILKQQALKISDEDNCGTVHDKLADLGAQMLVSYLKENVAKDQIQEFPQDETKATYCQKIHTEDLNLDLNLPPSELVAKVKAFSPFPGAYLLSNGIRFKILDAKINAEGKFKILKIKPEGKKEMSYKDFLLGHPNDILKTS